MITEQNNIVEYVLWKDACSTDPWTSLEDLDGKCSVIQSVGIVAKETEEAIVLCNSFDMHSGNYCCCINIPKSCVIKRAVLTDFITV